MRFFFALGFLLATGLIAVATPAHEPTQAVPTGAGKVVIDVGVPLEVFTYKAENYNGGPIILVFHGVGRNAEEYRDFATVLAERYGAIVAAPLFDLARFPSAAYQRGGIMKRKEPQPREKWTFTMVSKLVEGLRAREGRPELPFYFLGHSAGGQFVVRMAALAGALGAERLIAANPGSHLFPTRDANYGYGFGGLPEELSNDDAIRRYLAAPLTLYLGTGDNDPDYPSLDRTPEGLKQGLHRHARGLNCFAAALQLAEERGWEFNWRLVETPGIGHVAAQMFGAPEGKDAIFGADKK